MHTAELVESVIRYTHRHPGATLAQIAQAMHYSPYHLHRCFSQAVGMSVRDYALRVRLTRGAALLSYTQKPVMEIALACGYESQQAFSDAFSAAYHCPPARFRRQGQFYPLQPRMSGERLMAAGMYASVMKKEAANMKDQGSMTALMSAFGRAYHAQHEKTPVFDDYRAPELFSEAEYASVRESILAGKDFFGVEPAQAQQGEEAILHSLVHTHIAPTPLCRAAYCEQALATAERTGTRQYVILGAGLDTFAFRNPSFVAAHRVSEVDHPATQADKRRRITRAGWTEPDNLRLVGVDFAADDLREKLVQAGLDAAQKTFFSWLGVSYYLTREQIGRMLQSVSSLCAQGSTLVFDYADQGLFQAKERRVQNMLALAAAGGEPMKSCFAYRELETLLEQYGFLIYETLSPAQIQARLIDGRCADMQAFEHIHYVQAVRMG